MDYSELFEALEELEKERGIPKEYMLQKIEAGLLAALRKDAASSETLGRAGRRGCEDHQAGHAPQSGGAGGDARRRADAGGGPGH